MVLRFTALLLFTKLKLFLGFVAVKLILQSCMKNTEQLLIWKQYIL